MSVRSFSACCHVFLSCEQFAKAISACELRFPNCRLLFLLDNSSLHVCKPPDGLNANSMNVGPEGKQPVMRDGWFINRAGKRRVQRMTNDERQPKGLERVLLERGLLQQDMVKAQMVELLAAQPDFAAQQTTVQEMAAGRGHRVLYLPKYHAELSAIEPCWKSAKEAIKNMGSLTEQELEHEIPLALSAIPLPTIRAYYDKVDAYLEQYRHGMDLSRAKQNLKSSARERRVQRAKREKQLKAETKEKKSETELETETESETESESKTEPESDRGILVRSLGTVVCLS